MDVLIKRKGAFAAWTRASTRVTSTQHSRSGAPPRGRARAPSRCASCPSCFIRRLLTSLEDYPPPSAPPNVPGRTLGDPCERGLAPWFTMSAVNTPVLQRVLDSQSERADDWLPVHLRGRTVPPPSRPIAVTRHPGLSEKQQALAS